MNSLSPDQIKEFFANMGEVLAEIVRRREGECTPESSSVTTDEAASIINCSRSHVYVLFRAGKITGYRIGEAGIRIHRDSAMEFRGRVRGKRKGKICATGAHTPA